MHRSVAPFLALLLASTAPMALAVNPAAASDDPPPWVAITKPPYEAPGGIAPIIVTAWHPKSGFAIQFEVGLVDGVAGTCVGEMWHNAIRATTSQQCYLTLPLVEGSYIVRSKATFTRAGMPDIVVQADSAPALKATGYVSPTPMTIERARHIERCWNRTRFVWLTFDDSMSPTKLDYVLDIARRNNVRLRFFLTGKFLAKFPDTSRIIESNGHLLANHTYGHPPLSQKTDEQVLRQIDRGGQATTSPMLLRPPYGAGSFTTRLDDLAARRGFSLCRWTVDTNDWRGDPADVLIERVAHGDYRTPPVGPGGVILMHAHGEHTLQALQGIIDAVRARGLELDPLQ